MITVKDNRKNGEGYFDMTAYCAMKEAEKKNRPTSDEVKHFKLVLGAVKRILEISGFELADRVVLVDKKTGRIWK